MSATRKTSPLPRLLLLFAAGMVVASIALVASARFLGYEPRHAVEAAEIEQSRLLRFVADASGAVQVIDAETGETIADAGREGFIPGVLRGLNRLRMTNEAAPAEAYRLARLANGQLLLIDTVSGVSLDLAAYGQSNARVFRAFLSPTGDKS